MIRLPLKYYSAGGGGSRPPSPKVKLVPASQVLKNSRLSAVLGFFKGSSVLFAQNKCSFSQLAIPVLEKNLPLYLFSQILEPVKSRRFIRIACKEDRVVYDILENKFYLEGEVSKKSIHISRIDPAQEKNLVNLAEILTKDAFAKAEGGKIGDISGHLSSSIYQLFGLFNILQKKGLILPSSKFIDLGSGLGSAVAVAGIFCDSVGIEQSQGLHQIAEKYFKRDGVDFRHGNLLDEYFAGYDLLFLNLDFRKLGDQFRLKLEDKLLAEMKDDALVVLNNPLRKGRSNLEIVAGTEILGRFRSVRKLSGFEFLEPDYPFIRGNSSVKISLSKSDNQESYGIGLILKDMRASFQGE